MVVGALQEGCAIVPRWRAVVLRRGGSVSLLAVVFLDVGLVPSVVVHGRVGLVVLVSLILGKQ